MGRLSNISGKEAVKIFEKFGYILDHQTGSHMILWCESKLRKIGQTIAEFDLLIASVAVAENYTLVTNNTRHYSRIYNLQLENSISP